MGTVKAVKDLTLEFARLRKAYAELERAYAAQAEENKRLEARIAELEGAGAVSSVEAEAKPTTALVTLPYSEVEAVSLSKADAEPEVGSYVSGQGIYMGIYDPVDRHGKKVGKIYRVWVAPEDLPASPEATLQFEKAMREETGAWAVRAFGKAVKGVAKEFEFCKQVCWTLSEAVTEVSMLRDFHGFDGAPCLDDDDLFVMMRKDQLKDRWVVAPREILDGTDYLGEKVREHNLYDYRDVGALKGTFVDRVAANFSMPYKYWSLTKKVSDGKEFYSKDFGGKSERLFVKEDYLSVRVVRFEYIGESDGGTVYPKNGRNRTPLLAAAY